MTRAAWGWIAAAALLAGAAPGCGGDDDDDDDDATGGDADADGDADGDDDACVPLCEAGQAGGCTSITGDCGAFCGALQAIEDASGCADERLTYESCLEVTGACGGRCDGQETLLTRCVSDWCETQPGDASCATLLQSF